MIFIWIMLSILAIWFVANWLEPFYNPKHDMRLEIAEESAQWELLKDPKYVELEQWWETKDDPVPIPTVKRGRDEYSRVNVDNEIRSFMGLSETVSFVPKNDHDFVNKMLDRERCDCDACQYSRSDEYSYYQKIKRGSMEW